MTNKKPKFFICKHCGNLVGMILEQRGAHDLLGDKNDELVPNTTEAAHEKHLPGYQRFRRQSYRKNRQRGTSYDRRALHSVGLS